MGGKVIPRDGKERYEADIHSSQSLGCALSHVKDLFPSSKDLLVQVDVYHMVSQFVEKAGDSDSEDDDDSEDLDGSEEDSEDDANEHDHVICPINCLRLSCVLMRLNSS